MWWYMLQIPIIVLFTMADDHHDPTPAILFALAATWGVSKVIDTSLWIRWLVRGILDRKQARNRRRIHSASRPRLP